jgi:hypothetical protein
MQSGTKVLISDDQGQLCTWVGRINVEGVGMGSSLPTGGAR